MKPIKPITDPSFSYRAAATHDDGGQSFRRRMQARKRLAERKARQQATVQKPNVQPITSRRQKA